ncbi:hypothetical protein N7468_007106 [Penicillium chermesinum]|uniref:Autophagy-related protein 13 n=1 Tax=Penicillium chermesinum TaxID=63820 RepID=A0A9W9NU85_9EURO|nr:uncharacterized protein N7468_007106 [Penicillium chermesinum]KAJ5225881.1 hypothetical protein N7468_007106 [Penicillium chermesinum]
MRRSSPQAPKVPGPTGNDMLGSYSLNNSICNHPPGAAWLLPYFSISIRAVYHFVSMAGFTSRPHPRAWVSSCSIALSKAAHLTREKIAGMHQHPRTPAVPSRAPPPNLPSQPTSIRSDLREQDSAPASPTADIRTNIARGLGIEAGSDSSEAAKEALPGKEAIAKLNQIVANYHTKAALIILDARADLPPSFNRGSQDPRINRWFNVEIKDTDVLREPLRTWRSCDISDVPPPPLIIETYLNTKGLTNNESLVILDDNGKRWDVRDSLVACGLRSNSKQSPADSDDIILERWRIELGQPSSRLPADLTSILPTVYKKSIVLFRSLFTYSKFLPAWKFSQRSKKLRLNPALQVKYRVIQGPASSSQRLDALTVPLYEGDGKVVDTYSFGVTESPAGPFSVQVTYRTNCDFRVDDSEALLSSRFMGADDEIFRPSLPSEDIVRPNPHVSSVPAERRVPENPDWSQAWGSMSMWHQPDCLKVRTDTDPVSTLQARENTSTSASPDSASKRLLSPVKIGASGRAAQIASENGASNIARRPSVSFQPFKAPPLSASPALTDPPLSVSPRNTPMARPSTGTSVDSRIMPPPSTAASARRPISRPADQAVSSSNSSSPKPASISRYSSSFSHRRNRPSGGLSRGDDDASSGRASAASSNVQPGSGLLAEATGTSAESMHADDENISEFLKELDLKKDLLNRSVSSQQAGNRPTSGASAALARFQRMRESNAVLSDSISSSLHLQRSSLIEQASIWGSAYTCRYIYFHGFTPRKPMSPHTPHTPAIRSRLSSNSVADNVSTERTTRGLHIEHESPVEENPRGESTQRASTIAGAIDIPTSPRIFDPSYRRSSSAAQRRRPATASDEDELFPFGIRSVSLGVDGGSHMQRRAETEGIDSAQSQPRHAGQPITSTLADPSTRVASTTEPFDGPCDRGQTASVPVATSSSSNANVYQPRFASSRGRGFSGGPQSLSSASSSLVRGGTIPPHLTERDTERDGNASGSNSGNSTLEVRRGSGQRFGTSRAPQSQGTFEDDEPLLFAMSDFGASRRSLEENRHGNHGGTDSASGSRRGSGRRGHGLPGFQPWN